MIVKKYHDLTGEKYQTVLVFSDFSTEEEEVFENYPLTISYKDLDYASVKIKIENKQAVVSEDGATTKLYVNVDGKRTEMKDVSYTAKINEGTKLSYSVTLDSILTDLDADDIATFGSKDNVAMARILAYEESVMTKVKEVKVAQFARVNNFEIDVKGVPYII